MTIPDKHPDERGIERWFTISSSPTQADIQITTRLVEPKHSEFKKDLFHLEPGDNVDIDGPEGKFLLPEKSDKILWIAGGIGVTPYISQMQYLLDTNDLEREIILLHGLRNLDEDPCNEIVQKCEKAMPHFSRVIVLSQDIPSDWQGEQGYIDDKLIQKNVSDLSKRQIYVSGPEPMVDALKDMLVKINISEDHIHQDWFPGYKEKY